MFLLTVLSTIYIGLVLEVDCGKYINFNWTGLSIIDSRLCLLTAK